MKVLSVFGTRPEAIKMAPVIGELALASALGFDIGVYLAVFGGAMLILSMMGTIKPSRTRSSHGGDIDPAQRSTRTGEAH